MSEDTTTPPESDELSAAERNAAMREGAEQIIPLLEMEKDNAPDQLFEMLGLEMRPVKMDAIVLLQMMNSELIGGRATGDCPRMFLDCFLFLHIQSLSLRDALAFVQRPQEARDLEALALAARVEPKIAPTLVESISTLIRESVEGDRVSPVVDETTNTTSDAAAEELLAMGEGEAATKPPQ